MVLFPVGHVKRKLTFLQGFPLPLVWVSNPPNKPLYPLYVTQPQSPPSHRIFRIPAHATVQLVKVSMQQNSFSTSTPLSAEAVFKPAQVGLVILLARGKIKENSTKIERNQTKTKLQHFFPFYWKDKTCSPVMPFATLPLILKKTQFLSSTCASTMFLFLSYEKRCFVIFKWFFLLIFFTTQFWFFS